jgi:hypothetical protein
LVTNKAEKVVTISATPYSAVVNTFVYRGRKKNMIIFDPKLPIAKIIVLEASDLNLFSMYSQLFQLLGI